MDQKLTLYKILAVDSGKQYSFYVPASDPTSAAQAVILKWREWYQCTLDIQSITVVATEAKYSPFDFLVTI